MPTKLKVLVGLMSLSAALNLLSGGFVAAGIGVLLIVGVLNGSEGTRAILRGLAFLGLAVSCFLLLASFGMRGRAQDLVSMLALLSVAHTGFMAWCLGQPDVQGWMYQRGLPDAVKDL